MDTLLQGYEDYLTGQEESPRKPLTFEQWLNIHMNINTRSESARHGFSDSLMDRPYSPPANEFKAVQYNAGWVCGERLGVKSTLIIGKEGNA